MFSALKARLLRGSKVMEAYWQAHRSIIHHKPPKDKIGPMQSVFTICVFAVTLLAPAGWILHHIPDYRQRASAQHHNHGGPCT
ncbi:COX8 domain-containing protein [Syngnathoides biaculeatus]|uniref:COX8 domain-containing protein n=1 Tax=Syngnathoides biaculeatus TaxID=300417 RepID=UPI002ADE1B01|nr:COX8 domain-containing protein [Syngnathoides biaculeatus]